MKNFSVWSRLFLPGAGADPIWSEPESAPGPRTSGSNDDIRRVPVTDGANQYLSSETIQKYLPANRCAQM